MCTRYFVILIWVAPVLPGHVQAAMLLSLDARMPGADPNNEWVDLSGNNSPVVPNNTEANRQANRRVEIFAMDSRIGG